jgi:glutamate transport system permease protein
VTTTLFDAPGPKARARHGIYSVIGVLAIAALLGFVVYRLAGTGQLDGTVWSWLEYQQVQLDLLNALLATLRAFALGAVLALAFGAVFAAGRLSEHRALRVVSAFVVELFRAIPLLILIFFFYYGFPAIGVRMSPFAAVVIGLMLYNGSVLAEIFRAGILAVPKGQSEAAYALGLRKGGVMRLVLVPQATTAMMPAIVSQLVVLLKDTALGYIISNEDLLNAGFRFIPARYNNTIPAAIVVGAIYVAINLALGYIATWLERRSRRTAKSSAATLGARVGALPAPGMGVQESGTA